MTKAVQLMPVSVVVNGYVCAYCGKWYMELKEHCSGCGGPMGEAYVLPAPGGQMATRVVADPDPTAWDLWSWGGATWPMVGYAMVLFCLVMVVARLV
jgi:hypothetical protein